MKWLRRVLDSLLRIFYAKNQSIVSKPFPSCFYRGVANESDVDKGVYLKASAFLFGSDVPTYRQDGKKELSIVWNDDDEALRLLLRQKNKKGTGPQFAHGYATIQLSKFENTVIDYIAGNLVSYERRPIQEDKEHGVEENLYHGNILLHQSATDQIRKNVQHSLATIAQFSRRPDGI